MPVGRKSRAATRLSAKALRKRNEIAAKLYKHRKLLLEGTFVAIDPSCASGSSMPGYAIFSQGQFVEQGIIDIPYRPDLAWRLQGIAQGVREHLNGQVDLVIIEETPVRPIRTKATATREGKAFMNFVAISSQKQSVGAIKSAFDWGTPVVEMSCSIWQQVIRLAGHDVTKEDDDDARMIGEAALIIIKDILSRGGAKCLRK